MSEDDRLLSEAKLVEVTGKRRPHCQKAWFKAEFGVDLPANSKRVIISWQLFEQLQAKRAGLLPSDSPKDRPRVHLLRKSA
jgi:hypothetical protein